MAGYTRQSAADIVNGEVIKAPPLNIEFNQVESAFNSASGHKHDGTAGEGGPVPLISDTNGYTAVQVDEANAEVEFYVNVSSAAVQQIGLIDGVLQPTTTNDVDLGTPSLKFKDLYIAGTGTLPVVDIDGGNIDGTVIGATTPAAGNFTNIAASGSITMGTADIDGGTIDNTAIGSTTPSTGSFTTVNTSGNATLASVTVSGGTINATSIGSTTPAAGSFTTITSSGAATLGETTVTSAKISDLTSGRVVIVGTAGNIEDSAQLTYTLGTPVNPSDVATKGYIDSITVVDALSIGPGDAGKYVIVDETETGLTTVTLDVVALSNSAISHAYAFSFFNAGA